MPGAEAGQKAGDWEIAAGSGSIEEPERGYEKGYVAQGRMRTAGWAVQGVGEGFVLCLIVVGSRCTRDRWQTKGTQKRVSRQGWEFELERGSNPMAPLIV